MRISILAVVLGCVLLVAQGCSNPNAYQKFNKSYGYTGQFSDDTPRTNQGYVSFTAGKDISNRDLRWHCLRRIAELCQTRNFDYFRTTKTNTYSTTTQETVSRYWGSHTDAYGNKYNRYKVHDEKVPARKQHVAFQAFRGPMPTGQTDYPYYPVKGVLREYHGAKEARNLQSIPYTDDCAACNRTVKTLQQPEHCSACGQYALASAFCPHCFRPSGPWTPGWGECRHCAKRFRNAHCPHCDSCQTLRNCSPFTCAFCGERSESGVESGPDQFKCPHCTVLLGWPEELFGEYECKYCIKIFTIHRCHRCSTPHALQVPMSFTCWDCGQWIEPTP